jgi:hypothetical protein
MPSCSNGRKTSRAKSDHTGQTPLLFANPRTLKPSPENAALYRERGEKDSDYARLLESVRREGVKAPLLVSLDDFIISGHQRQKAAIEAGRDEVPVIFLTVSRLDCTTDEWLALLREHNAGREKTFDELVRERLVDIDPSHAVAQVVDDIVERSRVRVATIDISQREMKRYGISKDKQGMLDAIFDVLRDLAGYLPVSLRAVHYRLLNRPFFRNDRMRLPYVNDLHSYKDLSKVMTKLRIDGRVPWDWICDETRTVTEWNCWANAADFMKEQLDDLFKGFARDLLRSQQQFFVIVVEKLTVKNFVEPVAARYCMPVVVMRGNSGIDARHQIAEKFHESGKRRLFVLCGGDCDPDGDNIVESTLCSLRDDFGIKNVRGTRVAMTHAQADQLQLPRTLDALDKKSSNLAAFVKKHGRTDCYEMEAVPPPSGSRTSSTRPSVGSSTSRLTTTRWSSRSATTPRSRPAARPS